MTLILRNQHTRIDDPGTINLNPEICAQQHFGEEVNINNIVKRMEQTGYIPIPQPQQYGDVSQELTFQEALHVIQNAEEMFMQLDPYIRERFNNDPGKLLKFIDDPKNLEEGRKLGIFSTPEIPKTQASEPKAPLPT